MEYTILNSNIGYNNNLIVSNPFIFENFIAKFSTLSTTNVSLYLLVISAGALFFYATWKGISKIISLKAKNDECCCGGGCSCCCDHQKTELPSNVNAVNEPIEGQAEGQEPEAFTLSTLNHSYDNNIPTLHESKYTVKKGSHLKGDVPLAWGLYFQDGATPSFEGIVDLHNRIMFYLVVILFGVSWVMLSIMWNFNKSENKLVYRYLNHGKFVPIQKYFKFKSVVSKVFIRTYTTLPNKTFHNSIKNDIVKFYEDAFNMRKNILKENKGKSGIYMLTNKLTNDIYIGQSKDISKRFMNYFNLSYLISRNNYIISRALIKYGYSNFSLTILEYCDKSDLLLREQYYFDKFNPQYNILKIAGSSRGFKHSEETKIKISKALKGVYIKKKSSLWGRFHTEETKKVMSKKKMKTNNPLFGKTHSANSKELIRQKALNRIVSSETKLKMSAIHGHPINIYEKSSSGKFNLIGNFVSIRKAGKFLGISPNTITKYKNLGKIYKNRYKFLSK